MQTFFVGCIYWYYLLLFSFETFMLLSGKFHILLFILVLFSIVTLFPSPTFFSSSYHPRAWVWCWCGSLQFVAVSSGVGFLARFAYSKVGRGGLVAIGATSVLIAYVVNYKVEASRGRSRQTSVRGTDIENAVASSADVIAWRRRGWLVIMRARTRQRATRYWVPLAFRLRRPSDILSSPPQSVEPNDLRRVVDRVITLNESEIFRLIVSYL